MLGIVSAGITAYYIMKHDGRGWHVHIFDFTMYCGLSGIVGGRLWDVFFFDWPYYHNHLAEIPYVWQGGMAIQGGLLFGAVAGIVYTKYHHIDTWAFADLLAPAIILGQSIGRMANLMNGDASAILQAVTSASSIPTRRWLITPTAVSLVAGRNLGRPGRRISLRRPAPLQLLSSQEGASILPVRHALRRRTLLLRISPRRLRQPDIRLEIGSDDQRHRLCHRSGHFHRSTVQRECG